MHRICQAAPPSFCQAAPAAAALKFGLNLLILLALVCLGCAKEQPVTQPPEVAAPQVEKPKPAHFIMCIDNSESIPPAQQVLTRETTMLLADLIEVRDRISVVTFGKGARLSATSLISSDQDRVVFKKQVRDGMKFDEKFSDIRAGLKVLADQADTLLIGQKEQPFIIVLSDGKLEPANRQTQAAFDELRSLRQGALAGLDLYAVALGDSYCHDVILRNIDGADLNGIRLMEKYVATSADHFYHAVKLDQLLEVAVTILGKTKGISSFGEMAQSEVFRIDSSVESMTLIVRKKSTSGATLCRSGDITLTPPAQTAVPQSESIYRSSDYQYFDLIVVDRPREGNWTVSLANGEKPEVLSKIITPLEIGYDLRNTYFLNETAAAGAWVFDKKANQFVADQPIQIKAHFSAGGDLATSNLFIDLIRDKSGGGFYMDMPAAVFNAMQKSPEPVKIRMEFIAQRFKPGSTEMDPWFIRRSPPLTIELADSFVKWTGPQPVEIKWPFIKSAITFGADLATTHGRCPAFEVPPRLSASLQHYDEKTQKYQTVFEEEPTGTAGMDKIVFQTTTPLQTLKAGRYRYAFRLAGELKHGGAFAMQSPGAAFTVQSFSYDSWPFRAAAAVVLLLLLQLASSATARIQGNLSTAGRTQMLNTKRFISEPAYQNQFTLQAKRLLFVRSRILLTVTGGTLTVDGQLLPQGSNIKLHPGILHTLQHLEGGKTVDRQLMANV